MLCFLTRRCHGQKQKHQSFIGGGAQLLYEKVTHAHSQTVSLSRFLSLSLSLSLSSSSFRSILHPDFEMFRQLVVAAFPSPAQLVTASAIFASPATVSLGRRRRKRKVIRLILTIWPCLWRSSLGRQMALLTTATNLEDLSLSAFPGVLDKRSSF